MLGKHPIHRTLLVALTALGAKPARGFELTLVGFLRGKRLNVYTGFDRIVPD